MNDVPYHPIIDSRKSLEVTKRKRVFKNLLPLQVSCLYSTFSEAPLPYLGIHRHDALVDLCMHQLPCRRTALCPQLAMSPWAMSRLPGGQMRTLVASGEPAASRPHLQPSSPRVRTLTEKLQNLNDPTGRKSTSLREQILGLE